MANRKTPSEQALKKNLTAEEWDALYIKHLGYVPEQRKNDLEDSQVDVIFFKHSPRPESNGDGE